MKRKPYLILLIILLCFAQPILARTFYYNGDMKSTIRIDWERTFHANNTGFLEVEFAQPTNYNSGFNNQIVQQYNIQFSVNPTQQTIRTDEFGNKFVVAKWQNPPNGKIRCQLSYIVKEEILLKPQTLSTPFPVKNIPRSALVYLKSTEYVQRDDAGIAGKARELVRDANTQHEAVTNILNWIVDHLNYVYAPAQRDALYSYRTGKGNCENYAHLACAMMRSVGIPARVAGGLSVHRPWIVPTRRGKLTQNNGEGRHAWIEVYYPELGWAPYDPQQTYLFVNSHLIRNAYGLDAGDISEKMKGSPRIPREDEYIQPSFQSDTNSFDFKKETNVPGNYIVAGLVNIGEPAKQPVMQDREPPAIEPDYEKPTPRPKPTPKPEPPKIEPNPPIEPNWDKRVEPPKTVEGNLTEIGFGFGGIDQVHQEKSGTAFKSNAAGQVSYQYVTEAGSAKDPQIFAQAFTLKKTMEINAVYLLMHNFGGPNGRIWVELRKEEDGSPAFRGYRSEEKNFAREGGSYVHGYTWFEFSYEKPGKTVKLDPGRWWIVVRHDGNAIVNWQCIWGNPYGDPDDTKSTKRGTNYWDNVVNVDFNFRVRGKMD